jgi:hypothetical protein
MPPIEQLPYIDDLSTIVDRDVGDVWPVVIDTVERGFSGAAAARYSRLVGCEDTEASGPRPLAVGSAIPAFRVVSLVPQSELVLRGRHHFSSYALILRVQPDRAGATCLSAETRAAFPGVAGRAYRLLVIGTGGHVIAVQRLLSNVKRRSERRTA